MPEYTRPGVFVEEVGTEPRPIEGVATSTAGFAGQTERGPTSPRLVTSWPDYLRWFGDTIDPSISFMPLSVRGFFDNGGQRAVIARVTGRNAVAAFADLPTGDPASMLHVEAIGPGSWGNRILLRITPASQSSAAPDSWFRLSLLYYADGFPVPFVDPLEPANRANPHRCEPTVLEDYDNLAARPGQSNHVETVINAASKLVQVHFATSAAVEPLVVGRPNDLAADPVPVAGGGSALASGTPGAAIAPGDLIGDPALPPDRRTGLAGLGDSEDVALLVAPDEVHASIADRGRVTDALIEQCELRRDRFAILSIAGGQARAEDVHPPRDSSYGAVYHPWIRVRDARSQDTWLIPSVGHVAGIYARVDVERGVHKAPANEVVRGIVTQDLGPDRNPLEYRIREHEQAILSARGVNAIRDFRPERGIRVWGARTMSTDPEWRYVSVRRLLSYIEESIARGTRWVVFEPNGEPLWAQVRLSITSFLTSTWTSGALQGHKADDAFFVRCDRDTMTQGDIDGGRLVCQIGIAPIKPAEFVILRLQWTLVSEP